MESFDWSVLDQKLLRSGISLKYSDDVRISGFAYFRLCIDEKRFVYYDVNLKINQGLLVVMVEKNQNEKEIPFQLKNRIEQIRQISKKKQKKELICKNGNGKFRWVFIFYNQEESGLLAEVISHEKKYY